MISRMIGVIACILAATVALSTASAQEVERPTPLKADAPFYCTTELIEVQMAIVNPNDGDTASVICGRKLEESGQQLVTIKSTCYGTLYETEVHLFGNVTVQDNSRFNGQTRQWERTAHAVEYVDAEGFNSGGIDLKIERRSVGLNFPDGSVHVETYFRITGRLLDQTTYLEQSFLSNGTPLQPQLTIFCGALG